MPGDGAGRREDTRSRNASVWSASGPHPDNPDARFRDMNSFGQGERGAAGYEERGRFEVRTVPPKDAQTPGESSDSPGWY